MSTEAKEKEKLDVKVDSGCCSTNLTKEQELKKAEDAKLVKQTEDEKAKKHSGGCCGG